MAKANVGELAAELDEYLLGFEHVFSTVQWGGKLYKVPDKKLGRKKPKMFVFVNIVTVEEKGKQVEKLTTFFKMPQVEGDAAVKKYGWIRYSTFGQSGQKGWLDAMIENRRSLGVLKKLVIHTYDALPKPETDSAASSASSDKTGTKKKTGKQRKNKDLTAESKQTATKIERLMDGVQLHQDDEAFDKA
ncbi:hypothetical protein [Poriferisphaera sp. WC338]|uniref:hypothetical protein n=1 Tax=Poriferisphaera sp. WC338 TaxID=3425129 RepID=UPI003D81B596